ncbi:hypothetical protein [Hoeflea sp.]|uniref:hypothetical protein n=1 Tax=Hoeflea sp. TaxID=1940281 RepID=UPI00198F7B00|nr:hypothetical protein [Hoeflea sp.]MBC7284955.1 hypothetical protein [Hoeflea sp.]
MTETKAKSTTSNAGDGKTVSGAWSNHVSGCQDERLDSVTHQYAASRANRRQEMAQARNGFESRFGCGYNAERRFKWGMPYDAYTAHHAEPGQKF